MEAWTTTGICINPRSQIWRVYISLGTERPWEMRVPQQNISKLIFFFIVNAQTLKLNVLAIIIIIFFFHAWKSISFLLPGYKRLVRGGEDRLFSYCLLSLTLSTSLWLGSVTRTYAVQSVSQSGWMLGHDALYPFSIRLKTQANHDETEG